MKRKSQGMNDSAIQLLQLDIIVGLSYEEKLKAQGLINRGAGKGVLGYWYNLTHGCYNHLPPIVRERDIQTFKLTYPEFSGDIDTWI